MNIAGNGLLSSAAFRHPTPAAGSFLITTPFDDRLLSRITLPLWHIERTLAGLQKAAVHSIEKRNTGARCIGLADETGRNLFYLYMRLPIAKHSCSLFFRPDRVGQTLRYYMTRSQRNNLISFRTENTPRIIINSRSQSRQEFNWYKSSAFYCFAGGPFVSPAPSRICGQFCKEANEH